MIIKPLASTSAPTETDISIAHIPKKYKKVTTKEMCFIANAHRNTNDNIFIMKYQYVKRNSCPPLGWSFFLQKQPTRHRRIKHDTKQCKKTQSTRLLSRKNHKPLSDTSFKPQEP